MYSIFFNIIKLFYFSFNKKMLNLSTKEFDLNTLFSFDSLKEILLELSKSQIKLENSIKNIQKENKERDKKIIYLNKIIKNNDVFNIETNSKEDENIDNGLEIIDNIDDNDDVLNEQSEKPEENYEKTKEAENNIININDNDNQALNKAKPKEKQGESNQVNINQTDNKESTSNKEVINQENNISNTNQNFQSSNTINDDENIIQKEIIPKNQETTKLQNQYQANLPNNNISHKAKTDNTNQIPPSLIKNMMKQLKDQKTRIAKLEENIKNEFKYIKEEETKINNLTIENKSEFNLAQDKINSLFLKNQEIEQILETMQSDLKGLDFMKMFKDDGSGSIDATKVLVKSLQEKVFKKFELVEQRYKKDGIENAKTKSTVDNLGIKIDMILKDIEKINNLNGKNKDEFDEYVKNNDNIRNETKENIYSDINKKIKNMKDEHNNIISNLEEKIEYLNNLITKTIKDSAKKAKEDSSQKEKDKQTELENLKNIENKFIEINKKISGLDSLIKTHLKTQDVDSIKKDLIEMKISLNSKISKDGLKEIQNNIITNANDINDIRDNVYNFEEEIKKMRNEIRTAMQKIESFQGNLILMQSNISSSDSSKKVFDNLRYIDQNKVKSMINPIIKEIDEISKEMYSIKRDLIEADEMNKNNIKNFILKLDEENKNSLNEFKIFVKKKYLEKSEYNKTMKTLEVQLKYLSDEKKRDSESWLLGKQSIQCFNCASCEKNINKENYTTADYLAWKKYPKGDKIHRMGQGFSHMLEMMSEDVAKNIEKNDIINEESNNLNSENNNMHSSTIPNKERASSMRVKGDKNKEGNIKNLKLGRNLRKMKLPKMFSYKRYDIDGNYISDDENNAIFDEKENFGNMMANPRIMKILKKSSKNSEVNSLDQFRTLQPENK